MNWRGKQDMSINQSINQSNLYNAIIPDKARLSGATDESVLNSKINETVPWHQQAVHVSESKGKG